MEIREPHRDGQDTTWTGPGFMIARPNSELEFFVDNIKTSMDYDIVIRYEPKVKKASLIESCIDSTNKNKLKHLLSLAFKKDWLVKYKIWQNIEP